MSVRSCLVCRVKGDKSKLLRFVRAPDGEICFDEKEIVNQRGNWVCANKSCLLVAFKKRMLFRAERTLSTEPLAMIANINSRLKKSILSRLGLLCELGRIEVGKCATLAMLNQGNAQILVLANDISLGSIENITRVAKSSCVPIVESNFCMEEMGLAVGRRKTGVVGLFKNRITDEVVFRLAKLKGIEQ
jgi:predicted RNA-binding protein YlxR (DUF448 family)